MTKSPPDADAPACVCPTDDYCPRCHPKWYAKWQAAETALAGCCCEASPPEFGGNLPDRECPLHGEHSLPPEPCIAPPGNLCLDTGCWDADKCIATRVLPPAGGHTNRAPEAGQ